mmetsp:Transcript_22595/g.70971  ORF Transcript_22595/g.70971 Transcript_22595/m.70971 type:complete len:493 (-) Transcript_22595:1768-3246(-)
MPHHGAGVGGRRQRIPVGVVGNVVAVVGGVGRRVANAKRDDVLEKVRALRERNELGPLERRLDDEGRPVDGVPVDRDAAAGVGRAPPPGGHQQELAPLGFELGVERRDLPRNLARLGNVEPVGRDVDYVADAFEGAVPQGACGGHHRVELARQVVEAERACRGRGGDLRLGPDLEHVQLVLGGGRVAELERELDLDRAAEADCAEPEQKGERLRQRHLGGQKLLEAEPPGLRHHSGMGLVVERGGRLAVALVEDHLLAVHVAGEPGQRARPRRLGRDLHLGHPREGEEGRSACRQCHKGVGGSGIVSGTGVQVERRDGHHALTRPGRLVGLAQVDVLHGRHAVHHSVAQPQSDLHAAVARVGPFGRVVVDRVGHASQRRVEVALVVVADEFLQDHGHLLLLGAVAGGVRVAAGLLLVRGGVDHLDGPAQLVQPRAHLGGGVGQHVRVVHAGEGAEEGVLEQGGGTDGQRLGHRGQVTLERQHNVCGHLGLRE